MTTSVTPTMPAVEPITTSRPVRIAPDDLRAARARRDLAVDAAFSASLAVLAVLGLQTVYDDHTYLVIGTVGALAATAVTTLTTWRRFDPLRTVLAVAVAFVACSGVATATDALAGVIPTPASLAELVDGLVTSWANLVTTAPPVGTTAGLGVPPYVLGFVAAGGALLVARSTRLSLVPVAAPLVAVAASFVLGTGEPASVVLQGGLVAALCLAWGSIRANRPRRSADGTVGWPRIGWAALMVGAVVLVGTALGPALPFVDGDARYNLRRDVVPPFDPRDEASPLAAFREYLKEPKKDDVLFTVSGLMPGERLKLATMDTFDGVVWVVGGPQGPSSGRFERVGSAILPVPPGQAATMRVDVRETRSDVWAPSAGATRSMTFEGPRAAALAESFRYNRDTQSAALPARLANGDAYTAQVQLPVPRDDVADTALPIDGSIVLPPLPALPEDVATVAGELVASATTPYEQAVALEQLFATQGYFSDGGADVQGTTSESAPGHSLARLQRFFTEEVGYVGNAEQYASAMAVVARSLGLPARVAMGFAVPGGNGDGATDIHSGDIDAWVEIAFEGRGWLPFAPTPDKQRRPPDKPQPQPKETDLSQEEPPPPTYLSVPETLPELSTRTPEVQKPPEPPTDDGAGIPTAVLVAGAVLLVPLVAFAIVALVIVALKARRRRRRRHRRDLVRRLEGAWLEACDQARDLGADLPGRATRRESARAAASTLAGVEALAETVDAVMFGPAEPVDATVVAVWNTVEADRRATLRALPFLARLRARLSLASLRPGRADRVRSLASDSLADPASAAPITDPAAGPESAAPEHRQPELVS